MLEVPQNLTTNSSEYDNLLIDALNDSLSSGPACTWLIEHPTPVACSHDFGQVNLSATVTLSEAVAFSPVGRVVYLPPVAFPPAGEGRGGRGSHFKISIYL
jgi:hypothetical protein